MKRKSISIGIGEYQHLRKLDNTINDATDIHDFLESVGFESELLINPTLKDLIHRLTEFKSLINEEDISIIYFSGHGIQIEDSNFLVPTDAKIEISQEIPYMCLNADDLLIESKLTSSNLNVIILDACRNNPFPSGFKGVNQGLARMIAPVGTLIAFSTSPNMASIEKSTDRNGLYTKHLLNNINTPNSSIERIFKNTRTEVIKESDGRQVPWEESSLHGEDFYFIKNPTALLLYLKKELIFAYNSLTDKKIEFTELNGEDISKNHVPYSQAIILFEKQYEIYKDTKQPREAFTIIFNLQRIIHSTYEFAMITRTINFREIDKEIANQSPYIEETKLHFYQKILLTMEHYGSIFMNHDVFGNIQSIKRTIERGIWKGLRLDGDFLEKQEILFEDMNFVREHETELNQFIKPELILEIMNEFFTVQKEN